MIRRALFLFLFLGLCTSASANPAIQPLVQPLVAAGKGRILPPIEFDKPLRATCLQS
jgi:hypothetical protein